MAFLKIATRTRKGLLTIANVPDKAIDELVQIIGDTNLVYPDFEFRTALAAKLTNVAPSDTAMELVDTIGSLNRTLGSSGKRADRFIEDLIYGLSQPLGVQPVATEAQIEKLRTRLPRLLGVGALAISAKAVGVLGDNQRLFLSARVLSNIRPVFSDDVTAGPVAMVCVHELKVDYFQDSENRQFFVALDSTDIQALIDVLERTKQKEESLGRLASNIKIPLLGPK